MFDFDLGGLFPRLMCYWFITARYLDKALQSGLESLSRSRYFFFSGVLLGLWY